MSREFQPPRPEAIAEVRALAERQLSPAEFEAYVNAPMSDEERAEIVSFIDWFCRRYPTPWERLRYARSTYERWARSMP